MGNLFLVFTPLQLFVSQQIIRQEQLQNNVVVFGYRSIFNDAYNMMQMQELWTASVDYEDYAKWAEYRLTYYSAILKNKENFKKLKALCESHHVDTIYLGEVLNQTCRFTAEYFSHLGYKIAFFEEGTSHYINRPYTQRNTIKERTKQFLIDAFLFKPLYGIRFAKWHCTPNRPYDDLPMDKRFSMIPFHHKSFDVRLNVKPMFSQKLEEYVNSEMCKEKEGRRVMLMTDPLRELMDKKDLYIYFDTIKECIDSIGKDCTLYIKFHPREIAESRRRILEIADESGVRYQVLSECVNICVEYFLQRFSFEKIYFFNAATFFYNGYAYPKIQFIKLLPVVYQKCKRNNVGNLTYMENMLKMIEPFE